MVARSVSPPHRSGHPAIAARSPTDATDPARLAPEAVVWTGPARAELAGELLDVMGSAIRPIGVGGPRSAEVDALGKRLDCPAGDDLRKLRIDRPAAYLLLTTMRDVPAEELRAFAEAGTRVLSLEPFAATLGELGGDRGPAKAATAGAWSFVPAFVDSPGFRAAADPQDSLGGPRLVRCSSLGRPTHGSLLARLVDAWAAVLRFVDLPETIDASLTGPAEAPRRIAGRIAAHARVADGSAVVLEAADTAGASRRELSVLGTDAHLHIDDAGYELRHPDGHMLDHAPATAMPFVDLLADQWRQRLERPNAGTPAEPVRQAHALACVHACLLSAKTGQPERPDTQLALRRS
ncbi:MAG: hypothetical protein AAFX76_10545 [Planctomycetota bacterium]